MIIGEKISLLRRKNGWSQEDLADKMDVSRQSVSKWESAASIPDMNRILEMSRIFDVSCDYLLKDEIELDPPAAEEHVTNGLTLEQANMFMRDKIYHGKKPRSQRFCARLPRRCSCFWQVFHSRLLSL